MVDRITPATTPELVEDVERRTGVRDLSPVVAEPFTQWVLEDSFADGRPPFEEVGVQVVDDVEPYERMKLRLLNGSHQALAYFGHLLGHRQVHTAAGDEPLQRLVRRYMDTEAEPTLEPVPGVDLGGYKDTLVERFTNAHVADTVRRLCAESSDRIPTWVVPVIRQQLDRGGPVEASAAVVASWTRYAEGTDEQGRPIEVVDPQAERLGELARASRSEPLAFVQARDLFGDLADDERFTRPYLWALESLRSRGTRATLEALAR
jgi:mannitol 2-dehydrogenase